MDALTTELQGLTATVEGLRILCIGLTVTVVAAFALVLGLWNKVHPAEDEDGFEGNAPRSKLTGGRDWPEDPELGDLHLGAAVGGS